jgi:hypothetical protein
MLIICCFVVTLAPEFAKLVMAGFCTILGFSAVWNCRISESLFGFGLLYANLCGLHVLVD